MNLIPVCKPRLPTAEKIIPYIKEIDRNRWYSNYGPLSLFFEERLRGLFPKDLDAECVLASSGTAAITAAIIASCGRATADKPLCLMPSFTFAGSVSAVIDAGYTPYFVDVDTDDFMLHPDSLMEHEKISSVGVVLVIGAFGAPVSQKSWLPFQSKTSIQVIIDGAACFGILTESPQDVLGEIPVAISFHATKAFGIGEGGCIFSTDKNLIADCRRALNFGFRGDRNARSAGINGKLSEYGAAVGLAVLDIWPQMRTAWLKVAQNYLSAFTDHRIESRLLVSLEYPSSYVQYFAESHVQATSLCEALYTKGIDTRRWWEFGCANHDAYREYARDDLPVTRYLAERLIGLPAFVDLSRDDIERIARVVSDVEKAGN